MSVEQRLKLAVFIDFDNIEIGVKTTLNQTFDIGAVLEAIKERGEVITKVAYGDWKRSGDHGRAMAQHAVRMVQRVTTPGGDKNGADINLALDALEMAFTHAHINAFVIVGGDSDFITLVEKLKQYDRKVFVIGGRAFTSQVMQKNCTEFIAYENVVPERRAAIARTRRGGAAQERQRHANRSRQAVPLVKRALKVLVDREVSPQLGLLKSTLLQLDSSFSERDYGVEHVSRLCRQARAAGSGGAEAARAQHARRAPFDSDRVRRPTHRRSGQRRAAEDGDRRAAAATAAAQGNPRTAGLGPGRGRTVAGRRCGPGAEGACGSDVAAAMADVSAPVQAVPEERTA